MNEKDLRQLINEVTAEIIAEADADSDGTSDAEELKMIAAAMDGHSDNDDQEDYPQATHFSDDPRNAEFEKWANDAASLINDPEITRKEDIPSFTDAYGDAELNTWDEFKLGTSPEEYASLFDKYQSGGVWSDEKDYEAGFYAESKGFTFDKFMKDINSREDKIEQHKIELTENDGDTNARLKQKLYQEDWRNSVKFKGNK